MKLYDQIPGLLADHTDDAPRITPYLIDKQLIHGAVIVLPGGGYSRRAEHEGEPVAQWLNEIGLSAFVVDYRVAPYKHPIPLMDAKRAIRYVRHHASEWNIDPQRIGVLGFSAGGHLASTTGTHFDHGNSEAADPVERQSSRPDTLILCYPVISFGEYRHHGSLVNLLGEDATEQAKRSLSNELQVTAETPPTFLWHTADDAAVPLENSLLFAAALRKHEVPLALHVFPHGNHGVGLAADSPDISQWTRLCELWLQRIEFIT